MNTENKIQFPLQWKVFSLLILTGFLNFATLSYLYINHIYPSYVDLEENLAIENMERIKSVLLREQEHLNSILGEYAFWDDTYEFMEDSTVRAKYIENNLGEKLFTKNMIQFIYLLDNNGNIIWGKGLETKDDGNLSEISDISHKHLNFILNQTLNSTKNKISSPYNTSIRTKYGFTHFSASRILDSQYKGSDHGVIIMGRFLTDKYSDKLSKLINSNLIFKTIPQTMDNQFKALIDNIYKSKNRIYIKTSMDKISEYTMLMSNKNQPLLLIENSKPPTIIIKGKQTLIYTLIVSAIFMLTTLLALGFFFSKIIVKPVSELSNQMDKAKNIKTLKDIPKFKGNDEIASLGRNFSQLIFELKNYTELLYESSVCDGLTDLYNHNHILEILNVEEKRIIRYGGYLSILMLDLDLFKNVNDDYGHEAGDLILKEITRCLKFNKRDVDSLGRYGGDEFLMVLPNQNKEGAIAAAEKYRHKVEELDIVKYPKIKPTLSIGVYTIGYSKSYKLGSSVSYADQALYKAKENGRNQVYFYDG